MTRRHPSDPGRSVGAPPWAGRRGWIAALAMRVLVTVALGGAQRSLAQALSPADARAVRAVVESQLQAFAADDAERAFSYASAGIRARFGDAGTFMAMVHGAYPMVVRPAAASFFRAEPFDDAVVQKVHLRDRDGRGWLAVYELRRQGDEGWRIDGCSVVADAGGAST